jgi:hypothetical protein
LKKLERYEYGSIEFRAMLNQWQTSSLLLIERTFGKESIYYTNFAVTTRYNNLNAQEMEGTLLLVGVQGEVKSGFLYKIERLISNDFFDSINEQAEYLVNPGYKDAAAILGRVIIENTLKEVATERNLSFSDYIKLSALNELLWKNGVYEKNIWRLMQGHIDVGNFAAHGEFDKYDEKSVEEMLRWIGETVLVL